MKNLYLSRVLLILIISLLAQYSQAHNGDHKTIAGEKPVSAPAITSFSPSSGPVGTLVTINGTGLSGLTAFTIGGVSAIVISNSGTQLVSMVMPGACNGGNIINNISRHCYRRQQFHGYGAAISVSSAGK